MTLSAELRALEERLGHRFADPALLRRAVLAANQRVYGAAQTQSEQQGMGTTLTLIVVIGDRAHMAHVGDSRAYLCNAAGVTDEGEPLLQLSSDHTLVARLVDIGQLTPEQSRTHPHRNALYRALGTEPTIDEAAEHVRSG